MFQPLRFGFSGGTQKDSLDIFQERYNQPGDYSMPDYPIRNSRPQLPGRQNGNTPYQPMTTKENYAQDLSDQIREQSIRKRNIEDNRKREEQHLLRQSLDNYPFGREDHQAFNARRGGGLQKLYSPPPKPLDFSPQPFTRDFPPAGYNNKGNERPANRFQQPMNGLDSPFKKLLVTKPYSIEPQNSNQGGAYVFGAKQSDGEKAKDRREKLKEDWVKELAEQRVEMARRKEDEKRKLLEEDQLLEERLRREQAEINRAMALERERKKGRKKFDYFPRQIKRTARSPGQKFLTCPLRRRFLRRILLCKVKN